MTFQYKVESIQVNEKWNPRAQVAEIERLQKRLDNIGKEGWELISFNSYPLTGSYSGNIKGYIHLAIFKKPVD